MKNLIRILAACAALLAVFFIRTENGWCVQRPEVLSSGVRSDRGAVAWSPDGKRLAYVKKLVEVHNFDGSATTVVKADNPYFVDWSSGGDLLILHGREGGREMAVVQPETLAVKSFPLGVEADGVYPLGVPDTVLVTVSSITKARDGNMTLTYKLFYVNIRSGTLIKRFELSRPLPASAAGMASLTGWMQGGLHPLESSAVLLEYLHPPKHNPYMKLATVAPDTGREAEMYRAQEGAAFVPSGSFSPVGRRLALATTAGRLRILSMGGAMEAPNDSAEGFHPAWSPGGDWIYFGGALVSTKGKKSRPLLELAARSVGAWRADGNRLAVSSGGKLWVFDTTGLDSSAVAGATLEEMRGKVRLLRELLAEKFLDEEEYVLRYSNLLRRYGY